MKVLWVICVSIGFVIASEKSGFTNSKYIGALSCGYVSYRFWGTNKPTKELS